MFLLQVQLIQPWFTNESARHRKAAILAVALLCEGCSDHIKETYATHCNVYAVQHSMYSVCMYYRGQL